MKVNHVENIEIISQLPCLVVQPIAAHNLTIFLFDTILLCKELFMESTAIYDALLSEGGQEMSCTPK